MKKYLYEIDVKTEYGWYSHDQYFPFMPRVLAEKTVKALNRRLDERYAVSKTHIVTKDASPRKFKEWDDFRIKVWYN